MSRTVLVTGASSGIGRATALHLARAGDAVVLVARSGDVLADVAAECEGLGGRAVVAVADVSDAGQVAAAYDAGEAAFGSVDGVVHAAAVMAYGRFEDVPADVFDRALVVNVLGTANVAREALRRTGTGGPRSMVVVGSLLGRISAPYMSGYSSSKWAVHGLVRALQIEARSGSGLRIGLVSPGGVDTPIYRTAGNYVGRPGSPPPPVYSARAVADLVVRSLDDPRRHASIGLANHVSALGFRMLPGIFDRAVTPLMERLGLARGETAEPGPGNVMTPTPAAYDVAAGQGNSVAVRATDALTGVTGAAQRLLGRTRG